MILINNVLVSEDLIQNEFVCNLTACKGACCVEGDLGAPLETEELEILDKIWPKVKPYVPEKGQKAISEQGKWLEHEEGEYSTPLVKGKECAYTVFEKGIAFCAIEKAFQDGKVDFRKPVSCHLYPIRINTNQKTRVVRANYDRWNICSPACDYGKKLSVPVYKFLKEPIIRRFGQAFYEELDSIATAFLDSKKGK